MTLQDQIAWCRKEADWHRRGIEKTDDAFTRQNREFKANALDQIADNLKLLAQEKKTA